MLCPWIGSRYPTVGMWLACVIISYRNLEGLSLSSIAVCVRAGRKYRADWVVFMMWSHRLRVCPFVIASFGSARSSGSSSAAGCVVSIVSGQGIVVRARCRPSGVNG